MGMKKNLFIITMVFVLLSAIYLGFLEFEKRSPRTQVETESQRLSVWELNGYPHNIQVSFKRLILKNGYSLEEFPFDDMKKISFVKPGENGFGSNPTWEIFNAQGGGANVDMPYSSILLEHSEVSNFILTISNQMNDTKTSQKDFLAIIPKLKKNSCEMILKIAKFGSVVGHKDIQIPEVEGAPSLVVFPSYEASTFAFPRLKTETGTMQPEGCVKAGGIYYYYLIYEF